MFYCCCSSLNILIDFSRSSIVLILFRFLGFCILSDMYYILSFILSLILFGLRIIWKGSFFFSIFGMWWIIRYLDFHIWWKDPSHINLSFFPGFLSKPWEVKCNFFINLLSNLEKENILISIFLFKFFFTWTSFFSIIPWLLYLKKVKKLSWLDEPFIWFELPANNMNFKSFIIFSSHLYSFNILSVFLIFRYSLV